MEMSFMTQLVLAVFAAFMGWMIYRSIRFNRSMFTKENFSKTSTTLALLAIFLIVVIWVMITFLNNSA